MTDDATLGYIAALEKVYALARNQPEYNRATLRQAIIDVSGASGEYLASRLLAPPSNPAAPLREAAQEWREWAEGREAEAISEEAAATIERSVWYWRGKQVAYREVQCIAALTPTADTP